MTSSGPPCNHDSDSDLTNARAYLSQELRRQTLYIFFHSLGTTMRCCILQVFALGATHVHSGIATLVSAPNATVPAIPITASVVLPAGTVIGTVGESSVEYFRGIPFAHPPTGSRTLKPPGRFASRVMESRERTLPALHGFLVMCSHVE
jgi:hypothetical protein